MAHKKSSLRSIAVSEANYQSLKNFGRAGDSLNDVITALINRKGGTEQIDKSNK
jgi:predicted CopG family antitoxin